MTEDVHSAHTDTKDGIRKDLRNYRVQDNVYIAVFWKVLGIGKGPALSLYVKDREVLKFDCFGKDKGHYHAQTLIAEDTEEHRIFFREPTVMG